MSTFSDKIRELRKQKGVSQAVVAEYLGITKQAYSLYETGKREPDFDSLLKLAEYFGTDTDCTAATPRQFPTVALSLRFSAIPK